MSSYIGFLTATTVCLKLIWEEDTLKEVQFNKYASDAPVPEDPEEYENMPQEKCSIIISDYTA